ncbi:MAG: AAA family ATPase [Chitinophagaceae bacterium]|nr:AAA family ATPase [Chitinophagaceae bacterium]
METFTPDTNNQLFQLGINLVNHSARNIFLTGRAGTGKTTFLKYIRTQCPKQMAVVAPTGVAAINAGGVTIHSFFQLPLSPFVPGTSEIPGASEYTVDRAHLLSRLRMNSEKRNILRELELLIIDEISMVRADTLDALDTVLRSVRHQPQLPFGGVQVLMIGDLYQLPPVRNEENWKWLEPFYNNPYFFSSRVMQEDTPVYLEFTKIYRQKMKPSSACSTRYAITGSMKMASPFYKAATSPLLTVPKMTTPLSSLPIMKRHVISTMQSSLNWIHPLKHTKPHAVVTSTRISSPLMNHSCSAKERA